MSGSSSKPAGNGFGPWALTLIFIMMVSGALNTLARKSMISLCSVGISGKTSPECAAVGQQGQHFDKPWFQNLLMFSGELLVLIVFGLNMWMNRQEEVVRPGEADISVQEREALLNGAPEERGSSPRRAGESEESPTRSLRQNDKFQETPSDTLSEAASSEFGPAPPSESKWNRKESKGSSSEGTEIKKGYPWYIMAFPAALDVLGTGIAGMGLLYCSASVWQIMRGSQIIFTSVFSVMLLERKLDLYHWMSVVFFALGLALVGYSAVLEEKLGNPALHQADQLIVDELERGVEAVKLLASGVTGKWHHSADSGFSPMSLSDVIAGADSVDPSLAAGDIVTSATSFLQMPVGNTHTDRFHSLLTQHLPDNYDARSQLSTSFVQTLQSSGTESSGVANILSALEYSLGRTTEGSVMSKVVSLRAEADAAGGLLVMGLMLTLLGRLFSGLQFVAEELYVSQFSPSVVVGVEGLFGCVYMGILLPIFAVFPGKDQGGVIENFSDTQMMISGNGMLFALGACYVVSVAAFNFAGMTITKELSAVIRTLCDPLRTCLIWAVNLALFPLTGGQVGEQLTRYSWVRLLGFSCCVAATLLYKGILQFPYYDYAAHSSKKGDESGDGVVSKKLSDISDRSTSADPDADSLSGSSSSRDLLARTPVEGQAAVKLGA